MDIKEIYKQLSFHHLDDDDTQELAIRLWLARDSYNQEKGTISSYVSAAVRNYRAEKFRSKKEKEINMQIPLSHFEQENEDGSVFSVIDSYLISDELSPIDQLIDQENIDKLLMEINSMKTKHRDILLAKAAGEEVCRIKYSRAKEAFKKKKYKYILKNLESGEEFYINYFAEAEAITEWNSVTISDAYKKNRKFGNKKWIISDF